MKVELLHYAGETYPNIVLFASFSDGVPIGLHKKYFEKTHNIYGFFHEFQSEADLSSYHHLKERKDEIEALFDALHLKEFSAMSLSTGGIVLYFLLFHSTRIKRALIHDLHWGSPLLGETVICTKNWDFQKKNTPLIIYPAVYADPHATKERGGSIRYVNDDQIKELKQFFPAARILKIFSSHYFRTSYDGYSWGRKIVKEVKSLLYNGTTLKNFWKKQYPAFMKEKDNVLPLKR